MTRSTIGPIILGKIVGTTSYVVLNTPLIVRKMPAKFSGEPKDTWELADGLEEGRPLVSDLPTLAEAKGAARKLIFEAVAAEIRASYREPEGDADG